jgi:2',3'-cyclic-nucleotide 2'-phosphodiesterase (5'-nucleotidase family)
MVISTATTGRGPRLRIVAVNDVYVLDNLPQLASLIEAERRRDPADALLVTLAGDFLSPSMLSSLDGGRGMVDCLNHLGVTHVCFGNHEDDVDRHVLQQRLREFRGVWLSSNIFGFDPPLPTRDVVVVRGPDGTEVRVGLVAVCTLDPALYRTPPFDAAPTISPADALERETSNLLHGDACHTVIAMTHLAMADDRALAFASGGRHPLFLGGHDHQPMREEVGGTLIVKAGADAFHALVVDIDWPPAAGAAVAPPVVHASLKDVKDFPADPALAAVVERHMAQVRELEHATLLLLPEGMELSSVGTRARQTTMGSLLCARLRDVFRADLCFINGGGIRGARTYTGRLTYGALKAEVPFDNEVIPVTLPGHVIAASLALSRSRAPVESGAFLQVDDGVVVDGENRILSVGGAPFDPQRPYVVATMREFFFGMDRIEPLIAFGKAHPEALPPIGTGREVKQALVESFARGLWRTLGGFVALDRDHDGSVGSDDVKARMADVTGEPGSPVTARLVVGSFDADGDGRVTLAEACSERD